MHEALLLQSFPEEMLNARCSIFNVQVGYGSYQINVALLNETDELLPCFLSGSCWFISIAGFFFSVKPALPLVKTATDLKIKH